jgi:hypothetical protein
MMVDNGNNMKPNHLEYGSIIQNCRTLLSNYNDFIVVFIWHQVNNSAYALARPPLSHISRNIFNIILNCIAIIILWMKCHDFTLHKKGAIIFSAPFIYPNTNSAVDKS